MNLNEWRSTGRIIRIDGFEIFHHREGSSETLLCLHGFPASSFDYHKIWGRLIEHFDTIAFDMVGYGFSAKPTGWGYTTFDQVNVLEAVLKHLDVTRLHILAHDYGNTITQELLAREEEKKLKFDIATICFLNGALFPETHRPIFAQKLLISPLGAMFGRLIPDAMFKKNLAKVFGQATKPIDAELNDFLTLFRHNDGKRIAHRLIRYMTERARYRERWLAPLQRLNRPFRFINGSADPVSGAHLVKRFRELIPHESDIVELPGIGHFPHLETADKVVETFLQFHGIKHRT